MAEPSWIARMTAFARSAHGGDTFTATQPEASNGRLFGGLIAAQSLASASVTIGPDKLPQSLHLYFVRAGKPGVDVEYTVERTRDGRSFDTRRVTAVQQGDVILEMIASFHVPETSADWQPEPAPMTPLGDAVAMAPPGDLGNRFEMRCDPADLGAWSGPPYWIRSREPVEDDPVLRACALAYMSDIALLAAARPPGLTIGSRAWMAASLDHTIWFHRPFDPERWHRYQATPLNHNDSRGLALGAFSDADGVLVGTMAQEGLWRV